MILDPEDENDPSGGVFHVEKVVFAVQSRINGCARNNARRNRPNQGRVAIGTDLVRGKISAGGIRNERMAVQRDGEPARCHLPIRHGLADDV